MDLTFRFDPEVLIGADTLSMAGTVCKRYGKRIMIAADHSQDSSTVTRLKEILQDSGLEVIVFSSIEEDSGIEISESIVELSHAAYCDALVGFGGCKTQNIARMAAIMTPEKLFAYDLLDDPARQRKSLPFISIPTKGLDAFSFTDYFLVTDPRNRLLKSISSPSGLYSAVILDSSLHTFLKSVSGAAFLFEGFASAVEAYCSAKANFLSDPVLERAISIYAKMFKGGANFTPDNFLQANFLTALGSSASSPGAGSALAQAISTRYPVTKQQCSAALLPLIAEKLIAARPEKMARVASLLGAPKGASPAETAAACTGVIKSSMEPMGLQDNLKDFKISMDKIIPAAEAARSLDYIANSPWIVSEIEVFNLIQKII